MASTYSISATELVRHMGDVTERLRRGEPLTLTFRGWPVAELRPIASPESAERPEPVSA